MLFRFSTFRTSYFFPAYNKNNAFLYGLYTPYGSKLSKLYWWTFKHIPPVRWLTLILHPDIFFPYSVIKSMCPKGSLLSFNMGTPGEEQKISILGLSSNGKRFFAKYSTKPASIQLSINEIEVLKALSNYGIAPKLYDYKVTDDYVFFTTNCINGENPKSPNLNDDIWELLKRLSSMHLCEYNKDDLQTCLSHGDFTPWNMLVEDGYYRLIDWEMAAERPLGYDLFTFVLRQGSLMSDKSLKDVVIEHHEDFTLYFSWFGIDNYTPYLKDYVLRNHDHYTRLKELL